MNLLEKLDENQILGLKIRSLKPKLQPEQDLAIKKLHKQLKAKGIKWRPHIWFSREWFSPDGVGGFAIPFMLTHKKLIRLERKYLGFCEGASPEEFYKLCCHEAGHAIDNAYKLRLNKRRQSLFGLSSKNYPSFYQPNPTSKDYISFLGNHYAQAHPDEDWAETFAHYLAIGQLPSKYKNSLVKQKYELVSHIISELKNKNFKSTPKLTPQNFSWDNLTIGEYLEQKRRSLKLHRPNFYEKELTTRFECHRPGVEVASVMRGKRREMLRQLEQITGHDNWTLGKCFDDLVKECKNKKYMVKNERHIQKEIRNIIANSVHEYIQKGKTRIYM